MKTLQVTVLSLVALALSGCATGYYQRGYAGYGSGYYSSPSYSRSYSSSYYSPGTSITYGRYYPQPGHGHDHHDDHRDWGRQARPFERHDDHHDGWRNREYGRDFRTESRPDWGRANRPEHGQPLLGQAERSWGRDTGDNDRQRGGWRGRREQRDD